MRFTAKRLDTAYLEGDAFRQGGAGLRGSIMLLGPLLARQGWAMAPRPGGDKIGRRRLDTHFTGLQALGAKLVPMQNPGMYRVEAPSLQGTRILLDEASVTGTANVLMAASLTPGETTIYNAASEPYLQQLCKMINSMGGRIQGVGSNKLIIQGVDRLGGCEHRMLPDMIEIGSFIGLAATTQSEITIKNCCIPELGSIPIGDEVPVRDERPSDARFVQRSSAWTIPFASGCTACGGDQWHDDPKLFQTGRLGAV